MNRIECYQAACVALDTWACNGAAGRSKTDPVYQAVVQGRDNPSTYKLFSSCAERAHWRLWRLGCRLPFVNREEPPRKWKSGVNIAWLHDVSKGAPCITPSASWVPSPGDEMIIWNTGVDAHSLSVLEFDGARAKTANYGASGMSSASFPGAKTAEAPLVLKAGHWWYGEGVRAKQVMRVLRLQDIIEKLTAKSDLSGPGFDDKFTGEVKDFIESERA